MTPFWRCLPAIAVLALLACDGHPKHESFAVGMTRSGVVERFGEPARTSQLRKQDERIWGAIETFWSGVPLGSAVEIWSYRTTAAEAAGSDRRIEGSTELYFVDRSEAAAGLGFAPDGVVYESE